ncbi:hypothetical protein L204_101340 [Cryptococcus depauperatus]|nr:hypothetical protein L204_04009 [Cryptococcus depauperatus CBS 7855]
MKSVLPLGTRLSVSQTLPGSSKKHLLNPDATTGESLPWSSTAPSTLHLIFPQPTPATHLALTFQGGFVGTSVNVWVAEESDSEAEGEVGLGLEYGGKLHPEDRNKRQVFELPYPPSGILSSEAEPEDKSRQLPLLTELKLDFEQSSDHYNRVTLYSLEVLGQ